jgi:biotin transport system substrate-specific component
MTQTSLSLPRPARLTLVGAVGFAAALAAAAQVSVPIPGTAVPLTLQPFVVVLAGLWLGPRAAAASMALYLAAGAMALYLAAGAGGLPVWSPIGAPGVLRLAGPTGGYLLAYPLAAWAAGRLGAGRARYATRALAAVAGIGVIYAGGIAQLWALTGSAASALQLGVLPFVTADVVKAHLAALLTRRAAGAARAEG